LTLFVLCQFSPTLIEHLSDLPTSSAGAGGPSGHRQAALDTHIQNRINAELERLHAEEEDVRHAVERALEHENLDRQGNAEPGARSSIILESDLEALRQKLERARARKEDVGQKVKEARSAVVECYRSVYSTVSFDFVTLLCFHSRAEFPCSLPCADLLFCADAIRTGHSTVLQRQTHSATLSGLLRRYTAFLPLPFFSMSLAQ
jgi:altered-inheritance-of-mitochondria protein 13